MDWDLENENLKLERMIHIYQEEIEQLELEKDELKQEITFLKTQLNYLSMGNPMDEEKK